MKASMEAGAWNLSFGLQVKGGDTCLDEQVEAITLMDAATGEKFTVVLRGIADGAVASRGALEKVASDMENLAVTLRALAQRNHR